LCHKRFIFNDAFQRHYNDLALQHKQKQVVYEQQQRILEDHEREVLRSGGKPTGTHSKPVESLVQLRWQLEEAEKRSHTLYLSKIKNLQFIGKMEAFFVELLWRISAKVHMIDSMSEVRILKDDADLVEIKRIFDESPRKGSRSSRLRMKRHKSSYVDLHEGMGFEAASMFKEFVTMEQPNATSNAFKRSLTSKYRFYFLSCNLMKILKAINFESNIRKPFLL